MERSYSAGARARDARPEVIVGIRNPLRGLLVCGFAPPHAESEEAKRFATLLGVRRSELELKQVQYTSEPPPKCPVPCAGGRGRWPPAMKCAICT